MDVVRMYNKLSSRQSSTSLLGTWDVKQNEWSSRVCTAAAATVIPAFDYNVVTYFIIVVDIPFLLSLHNIDTN